ncbi:hypothetical protein GGS20DRAFT_557786 [Poronia punctata]|nr:hypothetical protein GGS20DRAFT_557786 [Poronia punctata]
MYVSTVPSLVEGFQQPRFYILIHYIFSLSTKTSIQLRTKAYFTTFTNHHTPSFFKLQALFIMSSPNFGDIAGAAANTAENDNIEMAPATAAPQTVAANRARVLDWLEAPSNYNGDRATAITERSTEEDDGMDVFMDEAREETPYIDVTKLLVTPARHAYAGARRFKRSERKAKLKVLSEDPADAAQAGQNAGGSRRPLTEPEAQLAKVEAARLAWLDKKAVVAQKEAIMAQKELEAARAKAETAQAEAEAAKAYADFLQAQVDSQSSGGQGESRGGQGGV